MLGSSASVVGYFEASRHRVSLPRNHQTETPMEYHHKVPRIPKTRSPGARFSRGNSRIENGKSTRKIGNHHHPPSLGTNWTMTHRTKCSRGGTRNGNGGRQTLPLPR